MGIEPDLITFSTLIKGYSHTGEARSIPNIRRPGASTRVQFLHGCGQCARLPRPRAPACNPRVRGMRDMRAARHSEFAMGGRLRGRPRECSEGEGECQPKEPQKGVQESRAEMSAD